MHISRQQWSKPVGNSEAARRAGGRRRYNLQRQVRAIQRQVMALNLWWCLGLSQAEIARRMGVHRSTICRYINKGKFLGQIKTGYTLSYVAPGPWRAYGYRQPKE